MMVLVANGSYRSRYEYRYTFQSNGRTLNFVWLSFSILVKKFQLFVPSWWGLYFEDVLLLMIQILHDVRCTYICIMLS